MLTFQSLYSCVGGLSLLEHDLLVLRQDLQTMAQKQMSRGARQSMETLGEALNIDRIQNKTESVS